MSRSFFEKAHIELDGQAKDGAFICLKLLWKTIGETVRFVLVAAGLTTAEGNG
jgi:hypothetical protein